MDQLTSLLSRRVDPEDLDTWELMLTCDLIVERSQHRTHERWSSSSVVECPACGRHRGIVTANRLPPDRAEGTR